MQLIRRHRRTHVPASRHAGLSQATGALAVAAVVALLAAACGSSSSSGSSGTAQKSGSNAGVAAANALINKYLGVPTFHAPGPTFDAKGANGKKVLMISLTDQVAFNVYIEQAIKAALATDGVQAKDFTDSGSVSEWVQGMNTAISNKDSAVALIGIDPGQIGPQITAAQKAGIKVIDGQYTDVSQSYPAPFTDMPRVASADVLDGELEGASAIAHRNGAAHVLAVESTDSPDSTTMITGIRKIFAQDCKACTLSVVNVPIADWTTTGQSTVQSALTAHPNTNFVIPTFDAMVSTFVAAAINASGNSGSYEIATADGSPAELKMLEQHDLVVTDVGVGYQWVGWSFADQILRALTGSKAAPTSAEVAPVRVFTSANVASAGTPPSVSKGYGDGYQGGFPKLWSLSS
jgi:ribose transport system substrate-binding protein